MLHFFRMNYEYKNGATRSTPFMFPSTEAARICAYALFERAIEKDGACFRRIYMQKHVPSSDGPNYREPAEIVWDYNPHPEK